MTPAYYLMETLIDKKFLAGRISTEWFLEISRRPNPNLTLSRDLRLELELNHHEFRHQAARRNVYGIDTGFGPQVGQSAAGLSPAEQVESLLHHLSVGQGQPAPVEIVRTTILLRGVNALRGYSAARPQIIEAWLGALENRATPLVPERGSVGASGDLIPLAYILRALRGEGRVLVDGRSEPADRFFRADTVLNKLLPREALAFVNGVSFSAAYLTHGLVQAENLVNWLESLGGNLFVLLGARKEALRPALHQARGHRAQEEAAANIRFWARDLEYTEDPTRPLQDIYSLRCLPQITGAVRQSLEHTREVLTAEINGSSDNPVFHEGEILHGGNFHGQALAFAADSLNAAVTQLALLADRLLALLVEPAHNGGLPRMLAWPGNGAHGVQGAQIMASATVAEMRSLAGPVSVQSVPTNGSNQDIVPMATQACRQAFGQTQLAAGVTGALAVATHQVAYLKDFPVENLLAKQLAGKIAPIQRDRPLDEDINRLANIIRGEVPLPGGKTTTPPAGQKKEKKHETAIN